MISSCLFVPNLVNKNVGTTPDTRELDESLLFKVALARTTNFQGHHPFLFISLPSLCRGFTSNSLAERRGTRYLSLHLVVL